jgi:hypothetical protein
MALDISMRDNGSGTFDIALSGGGAGPTGNSNFFLFFDHAFTSPLAFVIIIGAGLFLPL